MKAAFTLVEVLVVVGIIVLLAGILIPIVGSGQGYAERNRNKSLLVQVQQGIIVYHGEHDFYPLQANWAPTTLSQGGNTYYHTGTDGGQETDTNNLAYQLCHPDPPSPSTKEERETARFFIGHADNPLAGDLPEPCLPASFPHEGFDRNAPPPPLAIKDLYPGHADLIYIYNPLGYMTNPSNTSPWESRGRIQVDDPATLKSQSAFTHCPPGEQRNFLLVAAGPDGLYDKRLYDTDLPENQDNLLLEETE